MIGIDITRISRFNNASEDLVARVLHEKERAQYVASENKAYFLAGRWAIKEALFKADNANLPFNGVLLTKANGVYHYPGYAISTSAEDDYYIALVMKGK